MAAAGWLARVERMYGTPDEQADEVSVVDVVDVSLDPLGPQILFDIAGELGLGAGSLVVDVGARDGRQMQELQARFGCRAVGVEPMAGNLARADDELNMLQAVGEALPLREAIADVVWVRDVLVHVPDLSATMREIARIAKPGAAALVFAVFATERLSADEMAELYEPLGIVPTSMARANLERAAAEAGLSIERHLRLDGQWREYGEEHDAGRTSKQLLRVARLRRDPERYRAALGDRVYAVELADCLYGVYQLLGKLSASIYVFRSSGQRPSNIHL